jgi:TonB-linked SusC/RagA family outer membrane protein
MYTFYTKKLGIPIGYVHKIWLIMRLTTVILIATLMQVSAASMAQRITMQQNKATLKAVFTQIQLQTGYDVVIESEQLKNTKPLRVNFKNAELSAVLDEILPAQNLTYTIADKTIIVKAVAPSLLDRVSDAMRSVFKDVIVKGKVVDQDGKPLPNASIRVKGKSAVTSTNVDGEFEIKGVDEDAVLLVSYVGFKTLEIALKDAVMPLEIKLNVATGELEEVKVTYSTGYQNIPKERATGSFVLIDNELFNRQVGKTVLDRILDVTSGLIKNRSRQNGSSGIQVRGNSTINASNAVLIVVDNFIYEDDLNTLNPNDVENITVLKDAAAASIWGVKAGNGVIVITTKKGKYNQNINVDFNTNVTFGGKPELNYLKNMSSSEWLDWEKKQFSTGIYNQFDDLYPGLKLYPVQTPAVEIMLAGRKLNKGIPGYNALNDPKVIDKLDQLASYDVKDEINRHLLQTSVDQQYAMNISGGGINNNYYASVGFDKNRSNLVRNESQRLSLNFSTTYKVFKNIEVSPFLVYTQSISKSNGLSYQQYSNNNVPYLRFADETGNSLVIPKDNRLAYVDTASYPALLDWHYRPLDELGYNNNTLKNSDIRTGANISYSILQGLRVSLSYQYQKSLIDNENYYSLNTYGVRNQVNTFMSVDPVSKQILTPFPLGDQINKAVGQLNNWNFRPQIDFNRTFGDHSFSAMVGAEYRETEFTNNIHSIYGFDPNTSNAVAVNYIGQYPTRWGYNSVLPVQSPSTSHTINRFGSYYANIGYSFKNRYGFSASGRTDQSSFFGAKANQRIQPLWSAGLLWELSNEPFYSSELFPYLKIRATYGYSGNTNSASPYATARYLTNIDPNRPPQSAQILNPDNPQLKWERVKTVNLAVEFGLKNQSITGSLEYYKKNGLDLIGPIYPDVTTGVGSYVGNTASIRTTGVDMVLKTRNLSGEFNWGSNFLLSYNADKVTDYNYSVGEENLVLTYLGGTPVIGKPLNKIYSYRWAGLDPTTGTSRLYIADNISTATRNNVNAAKSSDLEYSGSLIPTWFGSILNTFSYRNLTLSFNVLFKWNYYFRRSSFNPDAMFSAFGAKHADYAFRWQKPGDELITNVPSIPSRSGIDSRAVVYQNANILIEKGDHIRLQDLRVEYDLRNKIKRLMFQNVKVYLYASNLGLLWTANSKQLDPDYVTNQTSPLSRRISLGLSVDF